MLAQHEDTGRQEGSSAEGTREKGAYSHKAMHGGAQQVGKKTCRGARDGSALVKEQRDTSRKIRTPAGM